MIKSLSFCIVRRSKDDAILAQCIAGILKQDVPDLEILICGSGYASNGYRFFEKTDWAEGGELNKMRNLLCENASKDFVVLMAEDIELSDGWYDAMKVADSLDIVGSRLATVDNVRAIDWAYQVKLGSKSYPCPLEYDEWSMKAYVCGDLMVLRKRLWKRIKFDETLTQDNGDDVDFCLRASKAGIRLGVFPGAKARYMRHTAALEPITFEAPRKKILAFRRLFATGKEAFNSRDYEKALTHFLKVVATVSDDAAAWSHIGWAHYFRGRYKQAFRAFDKAISADPTNHYALRGRGWACFQRGEYEQAVNDLSKAIDLINPNHRNDWLETIRGLCWSSYHNGNFHASIKYFTELLEHTNNQERGLLQDVYRGLGWSHHRIGQNSVAADYFNKAIVADPDNPELLQEIKRGLKLASGSEPEIASVHKGRLALTKIDVPSASAARSVKAASLTSILRGIVRRLVRPLLRRKPQ